MIDGKTTIEIALRAGQVAKNALEFTDSVQTPGLLKLRYRSLVNEIKGLADTIQQAIKTEETKEKT